MDHRFFDRAYSDHWLHRQCAGKVRFPSKKNAAAKARVVAAKSNENYHHYQCRLCRGWHIGHTV